MRVSRPQPAEDQWSGDDEDCIDAIMENPDIAGEVARRYKVKREPVRPKRKRPKLNTKMIAAAIAEIGHEYTKASRVVALCEGLSLGATGLYLYLESQCFDGIKARDGSWLHPPRGEVVIALVELAKRFAADEDTVSKYMAELREAGIIYRTGRGHMKRNSYVLAPRRKRLEWEAEQAARRLEVKPKDSV